MKIFPGHPPYSSSECEVHRLDHAAVQMLTDTLIEEVPIALVYNGISHAVMLACPTDLEDFALGFSLTEGIVDQPTQVYDLCVREDAQGMVVEMQIASRCFMDLKQRRRSLNGRTGCGLCGVESLNDVVHAPPRSVCELTQVLQASAIFGALENLRHHQPLRQHTGAAHAAAWIHAQGAIEYVREDVGRHNALDKMIGAWHRQGLSASNTAFSDTPRRVPLEQGFVLVTSRASYEMVQKVALFGACVLVAVSAPTALAVRYARAMGVTLLGFARAGQLVVYSHPERVDLRM